MSTDASDRCPRRAHPPRSRSSTRRCATAASSRASRSPSTTSCASPSSSTTSACTTSRAAGRAPTRRTTSSSERAPTELDLDDRRRWWRSARPAGPRARSTTTPTLRNAGRGRHVDGVHRRQVLGLPRHRGAADHARRGRGDGGRLGRVPEGRRAAGVLRRRALLRRLQAQPRVRAAGARGGGRRSGADSLVLCDTNGGSLPARGRAHRRRGRRPLRRPADRHPPPRTTPAAPWPTRSPACVAAPRRCRAPSTATASAPATATS